MNDETRALLKASAEWYADEYGHCGDYMGWIESMSDDLYEASQSVDQDEVVAIFDAAFEDGAQ